MTDRPIIVVMALEIESQGVFEAAGVPVLYTGIGKINAAHALTRRLTEARAETGPRPLVLNLGSAGSSKFPVRSLVECTRFMQRDMDVSPLGFERGVTPFDLLEPVLEFPMRFSHLPEGVCGSADNFETTALEQRCEVFDMEAYALARVCALEAIEFACVKYITDAGDADAARSWEENLMLASREWLALYEHVRK